MENELLNYLNFRLENDNKSMKKINEKNNLLKKCDLENILFLDYSLFNKLYQTFEFQFDKETLEFLNNYFLLDDSVKKVIIDVGFDDKQINCINLLKNQINKLKETNDKDLIMQLENEIFNIELLIEKIQGQDEIIDEFDFINELLNHGNISLNKKINLFLQVNNYNELIYTKTQSLQENILLEDELLISIFSKYDIDYNKISDELINYLKTNGNYNKIENNLETMKLNNLEFLFNKYEVLINILVHSSSEIIEKTVHECERNNILDLLKFYPTILIPRIKNTFFEKSIKKVNTKKQVTNKNHKVGLNNVFFKNIEFLKQHNLNPSIVFLKCSSFFSHSASHADSILRKYGINIFENKTPDTISFHVFRMKDDLLLERLDNAIECGCYEYISDNISRLSCSDINFYRVKYAISNGINPFKYMNVKNGITKRVLMSEFTTSTSNFGNKKEDTYGLYNAVKYESEQENYYLKLITENTNLFSLSYNNGIIEQLDSLFLDNDNNLIYNFNGIIISRNKVIRYLQVFNSEGLKINEDLLIYIVTFNTMLKQEELNNVISCVKKINLEAKTYDKRFI